MKNKNQCLLHVPYHHELRVTPSSVVRNQLAMVPRNQPCDLRLSKAPTKPAWHASGSRNLFHSTSLVMLALGRKTGRMGTGRYFAVRYWFGGRQHIWSSNSMVSPGFSTTESSSFTASLCSQGYCQHFEDSIAAYDELMRLSL